MNYHAHELDNYALPLPITLMAQRKAQEFSSTQPTTQKVEQVRLNTLAVYAVNDYLQLMGVATDLAVGDSWNSITRLCANVADLEIIGVGRLECRPLRVHEQSCYIPPEVWSDRIGYVVVQIDESASEATVLGFTQTADREEFPLSQLHPVEELIDRLNQPLQEEVVTTYSSPSRTKVNLNQWFSNIFDTGWQTIESLLNPTEFELAFSFRNAEGAVLNDLEASTMGIRRAKLIDLGMQLAGHPVALVVEVTPESEQKKNILLQLHPASNQPYLPPLLQLTVLDESGVVFLEAQSRSADNYIQLQLSGLPGEQFSVKVTLGDDSLKEDFVI